jgi:cytochrome c oxidase subunit II
MEKWHEQHHKRYITFTHTMFSLDCIQVHLCALTVAAGAILILPTVQTDRQRNQSARTEMLAAYLVLLLAIYLLCLLTSSWASRSTSASTVDLLAIQWYWTAASTDINNSTHLDIGSCYAIDVSSILAAPLDGITLIATALDVLHSIYLPSILQRADVIPARLSALSMICDSHGLQAGQCSELCGPLHGFMAYSI